MKGDKKIGLMLQHLFRLEVEGDRNKQGMRKVEHEIIWCRESTKYRRGMRNPKKVKNVFVEKRENWKIQV